MSDLEKDIKNVIETLFDGLKKSTNEEIDRDYGQRIKEVVSTNIELFQDLEKFNVFINYKLDNILEVCIAEANPSIDSNKIEKLCFLYKNYNFIEYNLEFLIKKYEGWICSADKTRWLVDRYHEYIVKDAIPDMNRSEKCYWKPCFGSGELWMNFCESLFDLYYGQPQKYLEITKELMKCVNED